MLLTSLCFGAIFFSIKQKGNIYVDFLVLFSHITSENTTSGEKNSMHRLTEKNIKYLINTDYIEKIRHLKKINYQILNTV